MVPVLLTCSVPERRHDALSCKPELVIKRDQERATTIVWRSFGPEGNDRVAPIIIWKEGKDLDCNEGTAFLSWSQDGPPTQTDNWELSCNIGLYVPAMHVAFVAWRKGARFSKTSFAHELCHSFFRDREHAKCASTGEIVRRANALLDEAGL